MILFAGKVQSQDGVGEKTGNRFTNLFGMEFQLIEPGNMVVGRIQLECPSPPDTREVAENVKWTEADFKRCEEIVRRDSRPGFKANIERPFYIGKYEVTQGQWKQVMGNNPSLFQGEKVKGDADLHPVERVTWEQAQDFIRKLNEIDTTAVYRLPTEFE